MKLAMDALKSFLIQFSYCHPDILAINMETGPSHLNIEILMKEDYVNQVVYSATSACDLLQTYGIIYSYGHVIRDNKISLSLGLTQDYNTWKKG